MYYMVNLIVFYHVTGLCYVGFFILLETLRMHSSVFSIARVCTKDFLLPPQYADEHKRVMIKAGTPVILPVYALHK